MISLDNLLRIAIMASAAVIVGLCLIAAFKSSQRTPVRVTVAYVSLFAGAVLALRQMIDAYPTTELALLLIQIGVASLLICSRRRDESSYPPARRHDRRQPGAWMRSPDFLGSDAPPAKPIRGQMP